MVQRPLKTTAAYAELGLRVLPLCGPACRCKAPGKRPWDPISQGHTVGWQRREVPTTEELKSWCEPPGANRANLGCLTGRGLVWLDVDGSEGEAQLLALLGPNPAATWEFRRGPDSRRLIYAVPAGMRVPTIGGDAGHAGLRILGDGAQSVIPPSRHKSGDLYSWAPGRDPWAFGPATPAPAELLKLLRSHAGKPVRSRDTSKTVPFVVPTGVDIADLTARIRELLPEHLRGVLDHGLDACPGRYPSRSEAIFALVGSIVANGVDDQVGAAVLASRPWVVARYGRDPLGGLMREFARARAKGSKAWHLPTDLRLTQPLGVSNPTAGPSAEDFPRERAATNLTPPPDERYTRRGRYPWQRVRLRNFDEERDRAVRDGLDFLSAFLEGSATANAPRLWRHIARLLDGFDRCRSEAWGRHEELRERRTGHDGGDAFVWADEPCDGRGHEDCAPYHALREVGGTWGEALGIAYPAPVAVLSLTAPGWGLAATREATTRLIRCSAVKALLPFACGCLIASGGLEPGYALHLIVPGAQAEQAERVLLREWRKRVPCGWATRLDDLPRECTALEALVELRVRSEQVLPLLAAAQGVLLPNAVRLYAREVGVGSDSERGGQLHRIVIGSGLRSLRKDLRKKAQLAEAQAAGAEGMAVQAGAGDKDGISESGDAIAADASDAESGWRPCPWDSRLEMRPSRDRKRGPAKLPWFVLDRMARDGLVEPIVVDGRVIGYRTRPGVRWPSGRGEGPDG